jgi:type II secretory pathway component PulC
VPVAIQDLIPKMQLQVVVYSETPAERLVFINNHKYLEGQTIEGRVVIERITPDSAILNYEGTRFTLSRQ